MPYQRMTTTWNTTRDEAAKGPLAGVIIGVPISIALWAAIVEVVRLVIL